MRKSFKYDKVSWLIQNHHHLQNVPLIYRAKTTNIERERFGTVLKAMQEAGLYSYNVDLDAVGLTIYRLSREAIKQLRRTHDYSGSKWQARIGQDDSIRQPGGRVAEMRENKIR